MSKYGQVITGEDDEDTTDEEEEPKHLPTSSVVVGEHVHGEDDEEDDDEEDGGGRRQAGGGERGRGGGEEQSSNEEEDEEEEEEEGPLYRPNQPAGRATGAAASAPASDPRSLLPTRQVRDIPLYKHLRRRNRRLQRSVGDMQEERLAHCRAAVGRSQEVLGDSMEVIQVMNAQLMASNKALKHLCSAMASLDEDPLGAVILNE